MMSRGQKKGIFEEFWAFKKGTVIEYTHFQILLWYIIREITWNRGF